MYRLTKVFPIKILFIDLFGKYDYINKYIFSVILNNVVWTIVYQTSLNIEVTNNVFLKEKNL